MKGDDDALVNEVVEEGHDDAETAEVEEVQEGDADAKMVEEEDATAGEDDEEAGDDEESGDEGGDEEGKDMKEVVKFGDKRKWIRMMKSNFPHVVTETITCLMGQVQNWWAATKNKNETKQVEVPRSFTLQQWTAILSFKEATCCASTPTTPTTPAAAAATSASPALTSPTSPTPNQIIHRA